MSPTDGSPFDGIAALQELRQRLATSPALTPLGQYQQARTGNLSELSSQGGGTPAFGGALSAAEHWLIQHESGGRTNAQNPKSSAFGLGQLLIGNRRKYLGNDYATTDYGKQLGAFRQYVADRYGSAEKAQAFWQTKGWY